MSEDEKFLSRWARLKREAAAAPVASPSPPVPVELPPVDSLGFESDFTGFLHAKVDEKLRQAALKKLFHSPHFNQMDGLDVYIDDYNTFEPLPESMLRELNHAQDMLFRDPSSEGDDMSSVRPKESGTADKESAPHAEAHLPPAETPADGSAGLEMDSSNELAVTQTSSDNHS